MSDSFHSQAPVPVSVGFPRQEYWSEFLLQGRSQEYTGIFLRHSQEQREQGVRQKGVRSGGDGGPDHVGTVRTFQGF